MIKELSCSAYILPVCDGQVALLKYGENGYGPIGGRLDDGEEFLTALQRELTEELGIDAQIGDLITIAKHTTASGKVIELHTYEITSYTGEIQLRVHDDMHWVSIPDLPSHPQLLADLIVSQILSQKPY